MPALNSIILLSVSGLLPSWSVAVMVWSSAVTVPWATAGAPPRPSALPTTVTWSPTFTLDESSIAAVLSPDAPSICSTATSLVGSSRTTRAVYVRPDVVTTVVTCSAPSMTWLLVSTSPVDVSRMPVPAAPSPLPRSLLTSTTELITDAATPGVPRCTSALTPIPTPAPTATMITARRMSARTERRCDGGRPGSQLYAGGHCGGCG